MTQFSLEDPGMAVQSIRTLSAGSTSQTFSYKLPCELDENVFALGISASAMPTTLFADFQLITGRYCLAVKTLKGNVHFWGYRICA